MNNMNLEKILPDSETILAKLSHDLKTPIYASIMAISLLNDKKMAPRNPYQKEIFGNVWGSMKYSKTLIEDILDRYKFNNDIYKLNKTTVNFLDFVNSVIENARYIFSEKSQKIKLVTDINDPMINLDTLEISRVIYNLISNSSKYAPEKSNILIRIFDNKKNIYFSIENQGNCTISPFKMFEKKVTTNNNLKTISAGLGLYIVKRIINAHGGDVFAETGNTVRVTFNLPK